MATLVGRHRRSRRGNRCSNARLSRSPSAPGGQIVRTGRRGRRDHLQNSWRRPAVRLDAALFGAIAVGSADRDFERAILHDQPRRAASRRRRYPRRARPLELPGDGEKPAGPGGHPPERGGAGSRRRVRGRYPRDRPPDCRRQPDHRCRHQPLSARRPMPQSGQTSASQVSPGCRKAAISEHRRPMLRRLAGEAGEVFWTRSSVAAGTRASSVCCEPGDSALNRRPVQHPAPHGR
jgi:hypothetical protein